MNKVVLIGRPTSDPEVRYSGDDMAIARYTLAVDRKYKKDGDQEADFIRCVAFGKSGEFAEKYVKKGVRIAVSGRIQTGSYTNNDGVKVYTTDVVVEEHDFADGKGGFNNSGSGSSGGFNSGSSDASGDGFMNIPDGIEEELPFN